MKAHLGIAALIGVCGWAAGAGATGTGSGNSTYVNAQRSTSVAVTIDDQTLTTTDIPLTIFGPFASDVTRQLSALGGQASAHAWQESTLEPGIISLRGGAAGMLYAYHGCGATAAESLFRVTFETEVTTTFALKGELTTLTPADELWFALSRGDVVYVAGGNALQTEPVAQSGVLEPGIYTLIVSARFEQSRCDHFLGLDAAYNLEFTLTVPPCTGDLNDDLLVDDNDFVLFAQAYDLFTVPPADPFADLNGDQVVDDTDFVLFAQAYDLYVCP